MPIITNDRIIGLVVLADYEQNAYNQDHLRLLQTLSSNMGVAIANARLFEAEEQRVAELQVINTIQQGLAAELDFQAIVDLVGDKLCDVFATPDLSIIWYDENANLAYTLYSYEHGKRLFMDPTPIPPDGVYVKLSKTRQPLVWNTEEELHKITTVVPGTDASQSGAIIPIISNDRVIGAITLDNFEREHAFGAPQLRLLTTVAATLGAALENAHLFGETQRLLKETGQRNNELAILNSVGEAMAKTLDVKTITRIVGDKVRDIFGAQSITIHLLDEQKGLIQKIYEFDEGEGGYLDNPQQIPLGTGLSFEGNSFPAAAPVWYFGRSNRQWWNYPDRRKG